ncbi:hypothetical protein WDI34_001326 [Salmonella enterica subsp. enterica]|nr:hypothetical protein [Salmonella enterica subsp. enterica]EFP1520244.1 hypothetical protein [Salmonella enterica]EJC4645630.1 hypothetical protein [Salmonella enterica]EJI0208554.1 hypothetical protein [Salmonella enterica subsp. enterica]EKQ9923815.1 hypothetical protein [Salmonella enterica subsp. enterica serovar Panama]
MRLPEKLPLYAKWVVVWLVVLPMILHRVEYSGGFALWWLVLGLVSASRWWIVCFSSSASAGSSQGFQCSTLFLSFLSPLPSMRER